MAATLIAHAKAIRDNGFIVEMVVWELPEPLPPCCITTNTVCFLERETAVGYVMTMSVVKEIIGISLMNSGLIRSQRLSS